MQKMKAGIIGCGTISSVYFTNLKNSPWVEVVACADIILDNAKNKAEEFNIPKAYTVEEMLAQSEIELIINLTIPASHANVDIASLEAGKHVYSEKPLAITYAFFPAIFARRKTYRSAKHIPLRQTSGFCSCRINELGYQ